MFPLDMAGFAINVREVLARPTLSFNAKGLMIGG
jgi:hypothetical protein